MIGTLRKKSAGSLQARLRASVEIEEASDAKSGERAFGRMSPDVTLIDINLPDVSGFKLMRRIRKAKPEAKIHLQYER
jgi:DNA-binding response OmpR family regulator